MGTDPVEHIAEDRALARFDAAIECLVAALLAFMPFALGVVQAWSEELVVLLAGTIFVCFAARCVVCPSAAPVRTWAYLPLAAFLLLVLAQVIPLPEAVLRAVSPGTVELRSALAGSLAAPAHGGTRTISLYPLATARALRLAIVAAGLFVVTLNVYGRAAQVRRLLAVIAVIAGGVATLALAQTITKAGGVYWRLSVGSNGGPFVNRNNFCQFMNLSLGAAFGLLLVKLKDAFGDSPVELPRLVDRLGSGKLRPFWYLCGLIVVGAASVFLSLSRGGMVSCLLAGGAVVAVLAARRRLRGWSWATSVLAIGAFACVLYVGFDSVYDRLASLWDVREYGGRWRLVCDSARIWTTFPAVGAGLGAFEYVFPMFDHSTIAAKAVHVENEYVQMAGEVGLAGLALIAAFAGLVLRDWVRCVRRDARGVNIAAVGLGAGLLAVAIHSLTDFGLRLPAIASLAAVACALVVGLARRADAGERSHSAAASPRARLVAGGCLVGVVAVFIWSAAGADAARRAEGHWRGAQALEESMRRADWAVADEDYDRLITLAARAAECQPGNVVYRHWLDAYRWRAASRHAGDAAGDGSALTPAVRSSAGRIAGDLENCSRLCPTFGPSYTLAGQLRRFVLGDPAGAELIRTGYRLSPCDAVACVAEGMLDATEGRTGESIEAFRRAVALDSGWFARVAAFCVRQVGRVDLAMEVAGDDAGRLVAVSDLIRRGGDAELASRARDKAVAVIRRRSEEPDASPSTLAWAGETYLKDAEYERAADCFRRALGIDCGNVGWRMDLARALVGMHRSDEARQQAAICLKLSPRLPAAEKLIAQTRSISQGMGAD
jgi:hypothetical protein